MSDEPTSANAQAANADPAQAATSTDPQAGDSQNETISLEEARKLRSEAANLRKRMKAYEEAEAAAKAAQQTDQERLQAERDELQARNEDLAAENMEYRVNQDVARYREKLNILLPADLLANLITWKEIEWDEENGNPTNIEKLLEKIAKSLPPELVKQQGSTPGQPGTPTLPAMNPGRSSITQPGGNVPGKRYTLDDIQWSR